MSFRMDNSKSKIVFKKRAHRPWQTNAYEENYEENPNVLDASPKLKDKQTEFLQKQLESTLEIKNREREDIHHSLVTLDDHRVTFGGFLKPKDILLVTEHESLKKASSLVNELKEKEREILEITQNLKITQATEAAEKAEAARLMEEKARLAAEEKAIFAIRQAHQTAEQIKDAEERVIMMEQSKLQLEQALLSMEERLKEANDELEMLDQQSRNSNETQNDLLSKLKALNTQLNHEKQSKAAIEETLRNQQAELYARIEELNERCEQEIRTKVSFEQELSNAHLAMAKMESDFSHREQAYIESQERVQTIHIELQEQINTLNLEKAEIMSQFLVMQDALSKKERQQNHMLELVNLERNLRTLFEEKLKNALVQMERLDLRRQAELQARRIAEEKTKHTIEQAGKAMIQLLHTPTAN